LKTSEHLVIRQVYTRENLMSTFGIADATIKTGIFKPKRHDSVWLFITKNKTADRVQYRDELIGDDLYAESQKTGRKDKLVVDSDKLGLELLVFYRDNRYEFDGAGFRYEGPFRYLDSAGQKPRRFHLKRISDSLRLVGSIPEVRRATWEFNAGAKDWRELAYDLLRRTEYWVYDIDNEMFGPAKFVGFAGMEFKKYQTARDGNPVGDPFDGHSTMLALQGVLGKKFEPSAPMTRLLVRWGEELLEKGCFDRIDQTKWVFLVPPASNAKAKTVQEQEYESVQRELDALGDLDQRREGPVRREQSLLRRFLFGMSSEGHCCICGQMFPIQLLVAAHIKRRSECSRGEKRDYVNNTVAMCRFGCDELFERGYIVVDERGLIQRNTGTNVTAVVDEYLKKVADRPCNGWSIGRAAYFRWHSSHAVKPQMSAATANDGNQT